MSHRFHAEQWLPHPPEQVFAFFTNPENLPRLMPAWQQARIEEAHILPPPPPPSGARLRTPVAGDGSILTLSFRPFPYAPFRIRWVALIGEFAWNRRFCDTQTTGPFRAWHHCHSVEGQHPPDTLAPGTLLRDDVEFELPLAPVSHAALPIVRAQLAATFRYRHQRTAELLHSTT